MYEEWTPEEEARRLRERFSTVKSKAAFARENHLPGGASMLSQHLSGHRPLNLSAATAYAKGFGVPLWEISPRLANEVAAANTPTFTGISGKTVVLDLQVDNTAIAITSAHHSAISAALHKVVDISQSTENSHVQLRFVIDDRTDPDRAKAEANILQAAAPVQLLSHLEQTAAPGRH